MDKTIEKRAKVLKALNDLIFDTGDEDIFERWLMVGIPDGATESDYKEIASETDDFLDMVECFVDIYE